MARKFQYYNVFIMRNGTATRLYFSDFLDLVKLINWRQRLRKIKFHPTALFDLTIPAQDQLCRVAAIGKYRQHVKPYIGDITSDTARMISNDIIEMTTIVAVPLARTVLVEYNFYGSKARDIQDYFNTFFPTDNPADSWSIVFDPIDSNKGIGDIRASNDIREFELKLNAASGMFGQLVARSQENMNSLFGKIVGISQSIQEDTDAPIVDLSFGKGRYRNLELDAHQILNVVDLLDIDNNDSVQSCRVTYRNKDTGKYEPLELKNVGIKSELILEGDNGNHGWQFVGDKILEKYISLNRPASNAFEHKRIQFTDAEMPLLVKDAAPQFIVPIEDGSRKELEEEPE